MSMKKFELKNGNNLEIDIKITFQKHQFTIIYDIWDGELDITEIYAQDSKINIFELCGDSVLGELKGLIIKKLRQEDMQNYIDAIAA